MESIRDRAAIEAIALLKYYGFDLLNHTADVFVAEWATVVPASWIRLAVLEALYQGRYKAISVAQLLTLWQRRNAPVQHFSFEFERLVCSSLPEIPVPEPESAETAESSEAPEEIPVATELDETFDPWESEPQEAPKLEPKPPIDRFTPSEGRSHLHDKLQNLAQPPEADG